MQTFIGRARAPIELERTDMEHPFLVEEFIPAHPTQIGSAPANLLATAEPQYSAALPPLPDLSASEVLFLTPSDPQYASYLASANLRTQLSPALRAVCKTEHAVVVMIDWVSLPSMQRTAPP